MNRAWIDTARRNLMNLPGWTTSKKIVVFESDDWGAIRMPNKKTYDVLDKEGFPVAKDYYNRNDCLESEEDLSALFDVLAKHKGADGKPAVFTGLSLAANPDFALIESSNFKEYAYQGVSTTLAQYGKGFEKVPEIRQQGQQSGVFHAEFHGREHIHVKRWMQSLQNPKSRNRFCFSHGVCSLNPNEFGGSGRAILPAFDLDDPGELPSLSKILTSGLSLFEKEYGYSARYFVAPNSYFNTSLEKALFDNNIAFLSGARRQNDPQGNGQVKKRFRYTGKKNAFGQRFLARNVQFEQGSPKPFTAARVLRDMETAFFWKKPVIISTHRVNYIGSISESNRQKGLEGLDDLLKQICAKWPDVVFMNSCQLGDLIQNHAD